jgi:hypothetical protein
MATDGRTARRSRRSGTLGGLSFGAAALTALIVWIGISQAFGGHYASSINLAYVATGVSVLAVIGGGAAIVFNRGRGWGAAAIVLGLLSTPLILTHLLAWMSGLG